MKKLIKKLEAIKKFGITAVKQSLEDEGASFKDIVIMRKITKASNVDLNVKIGGCEAKNDIFFCNKIKTDRIEDAEIERNYNLNNIKIFNGKKGQVIIEDTFGLHKGNLPIKKSRLMIILIYGHGFGINIFKNSILKKFQ